jgi:hypothetical protein
MCASSMQIHASPFNVSREGGNANRPALGSWMGAVQSESKRAKFVGQPRCGKTTCRCSSKQVAWPQHRDMDVPTVRDHSRLISAVGHGERFCKRCEPPGAIIGMRLQGVKVLCRDFRDISDLSIKGRAIVAHYEQELPPGARRQGADGNSRDRSPPLSVHPRPYAYYRETPYWATWRRA